MIYEAYGERTLIEFVCDWREISHKDACKGVSESAHDNIKEDNE